ncbi:MAG: DUF362 domain-containing protein [Anaerolineae bacterium]
MDERRRSISRRRFLRDALWLLSAAALPKLTGCVALTSPTAQSQSVAPTGTATLSPTATTEPSPTATAVADGPFFDPSSLKPVYVAHHPSLGGYAAASPFDPPEIYPELPYVSGTAPDNGAYYLVRESLRIYSPSGYGTPDWNPLGSLIRPGDRVLIKPNLVDASAWANGQTTHPAFLRPIIDYVYKACGPQGAIMVGDAPWSVDVFDSLVQVTGIREMVEYLAQTHGLPVILADLNNTGGKEAPLVDLGALSELWAVDRIWYDAHGNVMQDRPEPGVGRYRIAPAVLEADVILSVPKAKVHCSGGITVAMKNMIGLIPAWDGSYGDGVLKDCAHTSDLDRAAGERGIYLDNDTIWRSMADLNRILLYADKTGMVQMTPQRRYLALVDAVVAAEASQYDPRPYPLNTVILATDPISADAVTARCMGFDPRKLRSVVRPAGGRILPLGTADPAALAIVTSSGKGLDAHFRQALTPELYVYSWQGHLEASDFDGPQVQDWSWDGVGQHLRVALHDPSGVAWARLAYVWQGEQRVKALELRDGVWTVDLPLGEEVRQGILTTGDGLFNETVREIEW